MAPGLFEWHLARIVPLPVTLVDTLALADRTKVVAGDAMTLAGGQPGRPVTTWRCSTRRTPSTGGTTLLTGLRPTVAVCESDQPIEPPPGWSVVREKRYGGTVVTICRR